LLILAGGCKEKYTAKINTPPLGFLVVEGLINAGGPTQILLTRASSIEHITTIWETGAEMEVQSSNGASYPLVEKIAGRYSIDQVPVDPAQQYRLHIKTADGQEYLSDLVDAKISPPIDSVSWVTEPSQVKINVTTHDDNSKSVYYQWQYEETWKYESSFISRFVVDSLGPESYVIVPRPLNMMLPKTCWITDTSTRFILASSAKLQQDVIDQFPVNIISYEGSNRLIQRYSILVKQFVLSEEEYNWKQKLQKNTEQLGSIFDAQPSETGGNIHAVSNPAAKVIGFIGCGSVTEKRIFIDRSQLPSVTVNTGFLDCEIGQNILGLYDPRPDYYEQSDKTVIINYVPGEIDDAPIECVDCRLRGGVPNPPDFWQ
jgi:hypothetical protein